MGDEIKHDVARDADDPKNRISGMYISAHRLPYVSPTPGELPLIAIGVNQNKKDKESVPVLVYTAAYLKKIKDCGFNAVQTQIGNLPDVEKSIKACSEAGIKQVVRRDDMTKLTLECPEVFDEKSEVKDHILTTTHDPKITTIPYNDEGKRAKERVSQWVETTLNHKEEAGKDPASPNEGVQEDEPEYLSNMEGCGCYQLGDEPIMRMFPWFAKIKDRILESDKWERMSFLDLPSRHGEASNHGEGVGVWAGCRRRRYIKSSSAEKEELAELPKYDPDNLGRAYQVYMDEYDAIFRPSVWCFNGYFMDGDSPVLPVPRLQPEYFANLDVIRKQALKTNRPFWLTVRGLYRPPENWKGDENEIPGNYADLIGTVMNIEAHCGLAHGAKGIMFWTMMARPNDTKADQHFPWAPLCYDPENKSTESDDGQVDAVETRLYPKVKEMVTEVKRYGGLFLSSRVTEIGHIHHVFFGYDSLQDVTSFGFLENIETDSSFCLARHITPIGEFIVMVHTDPLRECLLTVETEDIIKELTGAEITGYRNGTVKKVPAGGPGGFGNLDSGNIYELYPDPYPSGNTSGSTSSRLRIETIVEPGGWRIFYRERK